MEMPCQAANSQPLRVSEGMSAIEEFSPDSRALAGKGSCMRYAAAARR